MSKVLGTFGTWEVTSDGINSTEEDRYELGVFELFRTIEEDGYKLWDFPIHLTNKAWLLGANDFRLDDFNQAFAYAQQIFSSRRPADTHDVSEDYTLRLQKELRVATNRR
jgi:hypothetical protein